MQFNIEDYKKSFRDLDRFRNDFLQYLGNHGLFELKSLDDIIYFSLQYLNPVNEGLTNTAESIEEKAGEALEHFRMKRVLKSSLRRLDDQGGSEIISTNEIERLQSYKSRYLQDILRLKYTPGTIYESLKKEGEEHLLKINSNIKYYSGLKFIKDFIEKDKRPSKHIERTCLDYYFRCIDEQQKIIDFLFGGGLKSRAVLRSTLYPKFIPVIYILGLKDFPYYSAEEYSEGYFNHNLINKCAHRVSNFSDPEAGEMETLYNEDKNQFYEEYFKKYSSEEIFKEVDYYLSLLPLNEDRRGIIEELRYLFERKRWISFYGLALQQIEGIFSEMLNYIETSSGSDKSLFYKVNSLRNFYMLSTYYFDYFQYHIPELRNKYSHGILDGGEKEESNSYDLLLDIKFLLGVFRELESPYINLTNIILKHDYQLHSLEDVVLTFDLINALQPKHKVELTDQIDRFYKIQLIDNKHLELMIHGINEELVGKLNAVNEVFDKVFKGIISITENNYKEIEDYFKIQENADVIKEEMQMHQDLLQSIRCYSIFYKNYPKKIRNINAELKVLIEKVFKPEKDAINKIYYLASICR